ncbi:MAG: PEP-CTERM sorting domain-containing protein [Fimbriimonadales bacterium]
MTQSGSGTGSIVSGAFSTAGPILIPGGTISGISFDIRLRNIVVNLHGTVTGFTTSAPGYPDSFGHRVYEITGTPTTDPFSTNPNTTWGQIRDIEANFGFWVRIGQANLDIDSWRAYRPVPEPASMLALGSGLVSLIAMRRRRK